VKNFVLTFPISASNENQFTFIEKDMISYPSVEKELDFLGSKLFTVITDED